MKRMHSLPVLIALILLPVAGFAQQNNPAPNKTKRKQPQLRLRRM